MPEQAETGGPAAAGLRIRAADPGELAAINAVIARARDSWQVSERLRRLAGGLHELGPDDLRSHAVRVAEDAAGIRGVAIAVLRPARLDDGSPGGDALFLQGLFVDPEAGRRGIGSRLLAAAETLARDEGLRRIDLRARREAIGFFRRHGFRPLGPDDARHAMSKSVPTG